MPVFAADFSLTKKSLLIGGIDSEVYIVPVSPNSKMKMARVVFRNPYVTREGDALPDWKKELPLSSTVHNLKVLLEKEYPGNPAARDIRLVFAGKMLSDNSMKLEKLLQNEDLNSWHTFHLIPARTGFSPSVSPADKKLPPDLSPLRGNSPDGEEPEQQQNIKTEQPTQSDRMHSGNTTPQRTTESLNREPTSSQSGQQRVPQEAQLHHGTPLQMPGQAGLAAMQQQQMSPERMQQYYVQQQQQWMAYYQQQQYAAMMHGSSPQHSSPFLHMNNGMSPQQMPTQQQMLFHQQAQQEAYFNYYRYMQQMYAMQQQGTPQQFQSQENMRNNTHSPDGLYRRGQNATRQRVPQTVQDNGSGSNRNANEIAGDDGAEARRVGNNVNANDRNVGNDNVQAPPRNDNNEPPQEGQGFLEMLNIRLVIKIAFFYMVFSQDQSKRHKMFLFAALVVYYFYCVGLLHFLLRAVTCGRHGRQANANNNENNQNDNEQEGNINIPTTPTGNIPSPLQSVGFITDLRCFVISFLFSLVPTWYPVAIPVPAPPMPAEPVDNDHTSNVADDAVDAPNNVPQEGVVEN